MQECDLEHLNFVNLAVRWVLDISGSLAGLLLTGWIRSTVPAHRGHVPLLWSSSNMWTSSDLLVSVPFVLSSKMIKTLIKGV